MSNTETIIVRWLSSISAGLTALVGVMLSYPSDIISEAFLVIIIFASAFLAAFIAALTTNKVASALGLNKAPN